MLESVHTQRRIGRFAWIMAWVGLIVGQLHALARFATEDGKADLQMAFTAAWAEPTADLLQPLLGWANPDIVYITYGKIWFPVFLAITLCAFVVYRRRQPVRVEKWAWRFAITAYALASAGVFLDYWTQWTGNYNGDGIEGALFTVAWFVTLPSFLAFMLTSTVLGVTLLVKRFRPTLPAVLLALVIPLAFGILQATSMGNAALPVMFAFGILGRRIARAESTKTRQSRQAIVA
ncbi:MAG: hypothetical protein ABW156_11980 [Jiangellaceae bacterium]